MEWDELPWDIFGRRRAANIPRYIWVWRDPVGRVLGHCGGLAFAATARLGW